MSVCASVRSEFVWSYQHIEKCHLLYIAFLFFYHEKIKPHFMIIEFTLFRMISIDFISLLFMISLADFTRWWGSLLGRKKDANMNQSLNRHSLDMVGIFNRKDEVPLSERSIEREKFTHSNTQTDTHSHTYTESHRQTNTATPTHRETFPHIVTPWHRETLTHIIHTNTDT